MVISNPDSPEAVQRVPPIAICLLGRFRVVKLGRPMAMGDSPKAQALLGSLAIRPNHRASKESLLSAIWPEVGSELSCQSLNSLTSSLRRCLGDVIDGASPIVHDSGYYRLNVEAGIAIDVAKFDVLAKAGERAQRQGDGAQALAAYAEALQVYEGDLCLTHDVRSSLERERLRGIHLTIISRMADHQYQIGAYQESLELGQRLLGHDPCREDAHRLVMRCCVRLGERAQALRQFRLCEAILRQEFDASPEAATRQLFEQVRTDPSLI